MPSANTTTSYQSVLPTLPKPKSQDSNTSPVRDRKDTHRPRMPMSTSVPNLPDVHNPPANHQSSFLQTLLASDQQEQDNQRPHVASGTPVKSKASAEETSQGRRGQRRRHSRDGPSSARRLSTSGLSSSKKKPKYRLGQSYDSKRVSSQRISSFPEAAATSSGRIETVGKSLDHRGVFNPVSSRDVDSKLSGSLTTRSLFENQAASPPFVAGGGTIPDNDAGNATLRSDKEKLQRVADKGLSSPLTLTSRPADKTETVVKDETTASSDLHHNEVINQWTTCRALDNVDDESDDEDGDNEELYGHPNTSDAWSPDLSRYGDGSMVDGIFSRATSSNLARRKRPLLLPPIMLPPIYSVKPTPLKVRDEYDFLATGPRVHRPLSDEEWDKLRDCRYLRIRTSSRPVRV